MPHLRNVTLAAALSAALLALGAHAADDAAIVLHEQAPVLRSVPAYAVVSHPVRECTEDAAPPADAAVSDANRPVRTVLGAVIGGLAGSTIGKGDGRVAAAAVGAAAGAVIGNNWGGAQEAQPMPVEHCRTVERAQREVVGYDVTYRYHGQELTARMAQDPGAWVALTVSINVAAR